MDTQAPEAAEKVDPKAKALEASKKAFEEAVAKTKGQEGAEPAKPEKAKAPVKQAAKPAPEKPKEDPQAALLKRMDELQKRLEAAEAKTVQAPKAKKEEVEEEPSPFEGLGEHLAQHFGEDEGGVLASTLQKVLEPVMRRTEALEALLADAQKRGRDGISKSNRTRLGDAYPQLKTSDEAWGLVNDMVASLIEKDASKFSDPSDAYDHVARTLFGKAEEPEEEPNKELVEEIEASAMTEPNAKPRERKLTREEKSLKVFKHLQKNPEDVAGARALARQLSVD